MSYTNFSYWLLLACINPGLEVYEVKELSFSKVYMDLDVHSHLLQWDFAQKISNWL